jgi:hypothetical protein
LGDYTFIIVGFTIPGAEGVLISTSYSHRNFFNLQNVKSLVNNFFSFNSPKKNMLKIATLQISKGEPTFGLPVIYSPTGVSKLFPSLDSCVINY